MKIEEMSVSVIIAAAGASTRMGGAVSKPLLPLGGRTVLDWSLKLFDSSAAVRQIIIAAAASELPQIEAVAAAYPKVQAVVAGGADRCASVRLALAAVDERARRVAVHDAARPLLAAADWQALLELSAKHAAAILGAPLNDSVKTVTGGRLSGSLRRESLLAAQTPQIFERELLRAAYLRAGQAGISAGDDAELVAAVDGEIAFCHARQANFKLTRPGDMALAEAVLARRAGGDLCV
ncbi:MAG: 2-C-methyl-D-erythritol 4-phosphate cytidylyltransferase [Bacillota bacterium]|nr:2-C-methyl-D-erythritol 4-phosphate cytidylyltransferase [Bacillota bacterium]